MHGVPLLRRFAFTLLVVLAGFPILASGSDEQPAGVNLFEPAPPSPRPRAAAPEDRSIRTRRRVRVRADLLQAPAGLSAPLRFNLFPGAEFTAVTERDETTPDGDRVLAGTLAGVDGSQFLLVMHGEEVAADVFVSPLERYQLRREPGEDGAPEVRRLDPTALPSCAGCPTGSEHLPGRVPRSVHPVSPRPHAGGGAGEVPDDPNTFDVLIAYTPGARTAAGGVPAIEALARLAVTSANQCYQNSGITTRARLVRTMEVPYTEAAGGVFQDLDHLLEDSSGPLADVRDARDEATADVACLFVGPPAVRPKEGIFAGVATFAVDLGADGQPYGVPEGAFSVVIPAYDVANTFPHEIGHNFGCQHDAENVIFQGVNYGPGIFPFSYGYRFTGGNGRLYRDVMAYDPGQIIPYFSNPQVLYAGVPTGAAAADNARTINATAPLIANLRRQVHVTLVASVPLAYENPVQPGRFTLRRTGPLDRDLTVNVSVLPFAQSPPVFPRQDLQLAIPGEDYAPLPAQVRIPAGQATADLDVIPYDDERLEFAERVVLRLGPGNGYVPDPGTPQATVVIRDTTNVVSVVADPAVAVRDPLTSGRFIFTRTGPLDAPLKLDYTVEPWVLTASLDVSDFSLDGERFAPNSTTDWQRTLTFPAGVASREVILTPAAIPAVSFFDLPGAVSRHGASVRFMETDGYKALVPGAGIAILDRPDSVLTQPVVSVLATVTSARLPAGNTEEGSRGQFTLVRTGATDQPLPVRVLLTGTAIRSDDYTLEPMFDYSGNGFGGTSGFGLTIPAGAATLPVSVVPYAVDNRLTKSLVVTVDTGNSGYYAVDATHATVVVNLLGTPVVSFTVSGPEARATSDLGPVYGEFTLRREGDLSQPLTVRYAAGGTAVGGIQYKALPGVATIPAGQDFIRVKVKPKGDAGGPGSKTTVKLTLQAGDGYVLGDAAKAKVKVIGAE